MHVGPRARSRIGDLLGRHSPARNRSRRRRVRRRISERVPLHDLRDAEVQHPQHRTVSVSTDHDVRGLDVAVHDTALVRVRDRFDHRSQQRHRLRRRCARRRRGAGRARAPAFPLPATQRHPRRRVAQRHGRDTVVVDVDDVGMLQLPDRPRLGGEPCSKRARAASVSPGGVFSTLSAIGRSSAIWTAR